MDNIYYEYFHDKDTHLHAFLGKGAITPKHFHRTIELLYIKDGTVFSEVGSESFTAEADDLVFVHNYYTHSFDPKPSDTRYCIIIPADYSHEIDKVLAKSTLPAHLSDKEFNKKLLPIIEKLTFERKDMPSLAKRGYVNVLMGYLFAHYPLSPLEKNSNLDLMVEVLHYIDAHYTEPLSLDAVSSAFGYNKYYFSRLFNKYIGENLSNYVQVVRLQYFMRKSKQYESVPVSNLALECGFDSLTTFYRCFNKMYGTTPKAYFASR